MATTRIIPMHLNKGKTIKQCLSERLDYGENPEKTENGQFISSYACEPETADADFALSKREYFQLTGRRQDSDVIAYQVRQSFKPGEITPEEANRIGYEFAERFLKGNHAFIVCTHTDKHHMHQIVDAEKQWRLRVKKDIKDLNANPFIINVRNGLYNVLDDTLTEHTSEYYSTVQLSVTYDKTADCPLFKKFLEESMDGDMEQVKLIQEILGYFLVPINSAQKCFVIVGAAGAGKSVLLRVLSELLLGKENVSNVSWQALNERFKTAELFGKLANVFADLPTKNIDDNGIFKALVGEDYLTVEKKNKNPFSFQSTARLLFSCNSIPKNYGDRSEGFYRRLIIIRFKHTVPKEKRDPGLVDKFRSEADGIFMFALKGLRRLMANNYKFSETEVNELELQQYREESDSVLSFVKECCDVDETYAIGSTELFNQYKGSPHDVADHLQSRIRGALQCKQKYGCPVCPHHGKNL